MTDESRANEGTTTVQPDREVRDVPPSASQAAAASRTVVFGVFLVIGVLVVAGGVWWYVGRGSAAAEQAVAQKMRDLGAFVHPPQEDKYPNTVNLTNLANASPQDLDPIIRELPALAHVENFNATNVPITDEHLRVVGQLDSLTQIILNSETGNSRVTDAGLAHLTGLDNLLSLNMYGLNITNKGLESVAEIESLETLDISKSKVTGDLSELLPLENLQWLLAGEMELSDDVVDTLAKLPKLSHLSIRGSTLSQEARDRLREAKRGITID